jgi:hypothetical protein
MLAEQTFYHLSHTPNVEGGFKENAKCNSLLSKIKNRLGE